MLFMRSGKTDNFSIKCLGRLTVNFSTLLTMNKELPTLIYEPATFSTGKLHGICGRTSKRLPWDSPLQCTALTGRRKQVANTSGLITDERVKMPPPPPALVWQALSPLRSIRRESGIQRAVR